MITGRVPNYWLFQTNPKVFQLKNALRAEALSVVPVRAHKEKITLGDRVILWEAGKAAGCYGLGTIVSEVGDWTISDKEKAYFNQPIEIQEAVKIQVDYNLWDKPITKEILPEHPSFTEFYAGLPGTTFRATKQQFKELAALIHRLETMEEPAIEYQTYQKNPALNLILYGPPGTGKTFQTVNYALSFIENRPLSELVLEERVQLRTRFEAYQNEGRVAFVTFHQSFAYEDFIEGIKPQVEEGLITYQVESGIFKRLCQRAEEAYQAQPKQPPKYILIIDEINRGNVASIFGELITLIEKDKRIGASEALQVTLPYSKETFSIPPNLHLLATMNTTDRSIEALDVAMRRRFDFLEKLPNPSLIPSLAKKPVAAGVDLEKLLTAINHRIEVLLGKEYGIGHSYFLQIETLSDLQQLFGKRIIPLLQEYFFNDLGKIGLVLGRDFIIEKHYHDADVFADFEHEMANEWAEKKVFELRRPSMITEKHFIRVYQKDYGRV